MGYLPDCTIEYFLSELRRNHPFNAFEYLQVLNLSSRLCVSLPKHIMMLIYCLLSNDRKNKSKYRYWSGLITLSTNYSNTRQMLQNVFPVEIAPTVHGPCRIYAFFSPMLRLHAKYTEIDYGKESAIDLSLDWLIWNSPLYVCFNTREEKNPNYTSNMAFLKDGRDIVSLVNFILDNARKYVKKNIRSNIHTCNVRSCYGFKYHECAQCIHLVTQSVIKFVIKHAINF